MKLELRRPQFYTVKRGQTLFDIANAFRVAPAVLADFNGLQREVEEGTVLRLPPEGGNRYRVKGGESKSLLCGSPARFRERNGTDAFYPAQEVYLP